jgi:glycosyltransferase involved in cell wall biosynthesis
MTIVYLLGTPGGWGGLERHTMELAAALSATHAVHLIADETYAAQVPRSVTFHPLRMTRGQKSRFLSWQIGRRLRKLRPHVIHAMGPKGAVMLAGHAALARRLGAVTIGSAQGTKKEYDAYRVFDGVVAVNHDIASRIQHDRIEVVPNGVEPSEPDPAAVAACRREREQWPGPVALAVGRMAQVKGYDVLLEAWARTTDAQLVFLGDGPERAALERQCVDLKLRERVTFLGHRSDVAAWMTVADVMVMSSRREGFPYVMVEALQADCPVLATGVGGIVGVLPNEFRVPPENVDAMAGLLNRWLPAIPELHERQAALFRTARQELTVSSMTAKIFALYETCQAARAQRAG